MDNIKIAMLAVSLLLNLYLISEQKKSTAESRFTLQGLTAKMEVAAKSGGSAEASSNISDKALIDLVNQTVRDEFSRAVPNDNGSGAANAAIEQRIQKLQARADALSAEIQKRGAGAGSEKEKKLREEAQKMKQEVLALCVKK